jgi:hypothetical protein
VVTLLGLPLALATLAAAPADEPVIDHQPITCTLPEKHPRLCTYVADDGEVKRARVYFRAKGQEAFYWTDMIFDGIQYCVTLPAPKKGVQAIEYYLWAVDDSFTSQRTRTFELSFLPSGCDYPVFDEDPERTSKIIVNATSEKQGKKIEGFSDQGILHFIPVEKRKK